jgi:hypothetical protein
MIMKAIDYYETYWHRFFGKVFTEEEINAALKDILLKFNDEIKELVNLRHATSDEAGVAIIQEQNNKWNALSRIFEKRQGCSFLAKDGFKLFWKNHIPELKV